MEEKLGNERQISPKELLDIIGYSPADNVEGYETYVPWISRLVSDQVKCVFKWKGVLDAVSGQGGILGAGLAASAAFQRDILETWFADPIRIHAKLHTRVKKNPDIFVASDNDVEAVYAALLYRFCGYFMKNGEFHIHKARRVRSGKEGREFLKNYMKEFASLEHRYCAMGMTRLSAMKELLLTLVMVITEKVPEDRDPPFVKRTSDGFLPMAEEEYLLHAKRRLENLYNRDAFNLVAFSERATGGMIGYCDYDIVENSGYHSATLRYYPLPPGLSSNGTVLYLSNSLIHKPEIYDLGHEKSVIEGMLKEGYEVYMMDPGEPGPDESRLGLDFYGKILHERYLALIKARHPGRPIHAMGYCMGGTLLLPYLARRAEERMGMGLPMDIRKVALMVAPFKFDDDKSGQRPMRKTIRENYDAELIEEIYGEVNLPNHLIEVGMSEIQPGIWYTVTSGFYARAGFPGAVEDSAPFLYWILHGTRFPARAHSEWVQRLFLGNEIVNGTYCLPSTRPELDGKPVDMEILRKAGVAIFDYRGQRDPISPVGSCVAGELWGKRRTGNIAQVRGGLNRTMEKNAGHIFVISKILLAEYLETVTEFFREKEAWVDSEELAGDGEETLLN